MSYDAASGKRRELISTAQLVPPGATEPLAIQSYVFSPDGSRILLQASSNEDGNRVTGYWMLEQKSGTLKKVMAGSLGSLSTEEQAAGVQELGRTRSYVDLSRVGIWGWSGGGSNTLNAMFRKPDVYHVGIAVAAKPQPHLYNASF
ncbi:hypothetical protein ES708_33879 [subsurface metagenome]